jgi:two-component system, cell cycle sensor histidine kinase and response regulator CckA
MPDPSGAVTVLLVDDTDSVRLVAERMLQLAGYRVVTCGSGEEALTIMGTAETPPDVLVSDVMLGGIPGTELAERMRRLHPTIGVVLMSGYTPEEVWEEGGEAFLLAKPFTRRDLVGAIEGALRTGGAGD